jgi:hypothetical protein
MFRVYTSINSSAVADLKGGSSSRPLSLEIYHVILNFRSKIPYFIANFSRVGDWVPLSGGPLFRNFWIRH